MLPQPQPFMFSAIQWNEVKKEIVRKVSEYTQH